MTTPPSFAPQPCCDSAADAASCGTPIQFCQTTTSTGPVEHPGRQYDLTLPINPGFAVESMQVDQVTNAANIIWDVADPDGEQFRQDLTTFMEGRLPAAATVTITNPNAGTPQVCGAAAPMQIHIECLRLDQTPPDLIELVYNGGQDMVQNPAYNEFPPLDPPVAQGDYGFHLLKRQDDPAGGTFPRVLCTDTANRGWETNDAGDSFEIWGRNIVQGEDVTPTPRGTPVQEITSDGPPAGGINTIWQTFQAPASGNFIIRVVHGARDPGETHRITLDNGDTDDQQNGDLIDDVTTPPSVTENGGPNPWTQFERSIPLTGGSTYTLALSTTDPSGDARGGLFTDMRAYIDRPGQRATATTDDDTCVVTTEETTRNTTCTFWQPICSAGEIASWRNVQNGTTLTNAEFWAQTPTPSCCGTDGGAGEGEASATLSNMAVSDTVCGQVGGVPQNLIRQVVLDPSGGALSTTFFSEDGAPVTPASWTPGACTSERYVEDIVLCDQIPASGTVSFIRKYVQSLSGTGAGQMNSFRDFEFSGIPYTVQGTVVDCTDVIADRETVCWTDTATGDLIHTGTIRHQDGVNPQGWLLFDQNQTLVSDTSGVTFVPCAEAMDPVATTGLCLSDGTPIAVVVRRNSVTGAVAQDGWVNLTTGAFTAGSPPVGTIACGESRSIQVSGTFCSVDDTTGDVLALVLIEYTYAPDGSIASVRLVNAVDGTTYAVPAGATITTCPTGTEQPEQDTEVLCSIDNSSGVATPFIRDYRRDQNGTITATSDYTLAGAAFTVPGTSTVGRCPDQDSETLVLCADNGTFLRTYVYRPDGQIRATFSTDFAGQPFVPSGVVRVCESTGADLDFLEEILCSTDGAGVVTPFIRRFTLNSTTGAVTATTNLTLAGAAFTPATVGLCSDCCGQVIGQGCTNTGSGRYAAIRAANGTVTLIDSVSGATVTAANVVPCPSDDTVRTLTSQARLITDAGPAWMPANDVAGTATSVTVTGLTGTWDLVDANGTTLVGLPSGLTLSWTAEDDNTLTPPQVITPQAASTIVVNWTQRP